MRVIQRDGKFLAKFVNRFHKGTLYVLDLDLDVTITTVVNCVIYK